MQSAQIRLERHFPAAVAGNWSATELAEAAETPPKAAWRFLSKKRGQLARSNDAKVLGIAGRFWAALEGRAALDCEALAKLNAAQSAGRPVDQREVSALVKRMLSVLSAGKSLAPRPTEDGRTISMDSSV